MLEQQLTDFKERVNANTKIKKLTKNWNPNIIIKSTDSNEEFTLKIGDSEITEILTLVENADHEITIEGKHTVLMDIFSGKTNPVQAVMDGKLALFGTQKDQIKLDILALTVWA